MVEAGCAATGDFVLAAVLLLGMTLAPAYGWWSDVKYDLLRNDIRACFLCTLYCTMSIYGV